MQNWLRDFFIPHAGNDYRPHSLQRLAFFCMLFLVVFTFALSNLHSLLWIGSEWLVSTVLPSVIVELTNQERIAEAAGQLSRNASLDVAATLKAEHMAANEYFSHYSPTGVSPWYWFGEVDYQFVHAGENLAIHFNDSSAVVEAWMNSPTHRANIINQNFTEIGVGTALGTYQGFSTVYVVQLFGTPAAATTVAGANQALEEPTPAAPTTAPVDNSPPAQIAAAEDVITSVDETEVELRSEREPITVPEQPTTPVTSTSEIAEVVVEEETVSIYSELMTTSTGALPATIDPVSETSVSTPAIYRVATQPQTVLQYIYLALAVFVTLILCLSIFIEIRRQQPIQIAYSTALVALMGLLYYTHVVLTGGVLVA